MFDFYYKNNIKIKLSIKKTHFLVTCCAFFLMLHTYSLFSFKPNDISKLNHALVLHFY